MEAALGIEFQSLSDGTVLVMFQNEDLATINKQLITPDVVEAMPVLVRLLQAVEPTTQSRRKTCPQTKPKQENRF